MTARPSWARARIRRRTIGLPAGQLAPRTPEQALQAAYVSLKAQLPATLSPREYELACRRIARELGLPCDA